MRRIPSLALAAVEARPAAGRVRRHGARRALIVVVLVLAVVIGGATGAAAGPGAPSEPAGPDAPGPGTEVLVANVSGLLDPVLVDFVERSIADAERREVVALVLQLNSEGAVVDDDRLAELARRMRDATVPVDVWIGPSGAKATGAAAELVGVADTVGMAPGTRLGRIGGLRLPVEEFGPVFGDQTALLLEDAVSAEDALELGLVTDFGPVEAPDGAADVAAVAGAPTVGDFIVNLDGVETAELEVDGQVRRRTVTVVLFTRLSILDQLAHTVASPPIAYLLFAIGLGLLVFEFFTAGVGVAGMVGAGCLVLGSYGLAVLPTRPVAVGLLVLAFLAFAVDVQTGVPRVWTVIGVLAFVSGSLALYDGLELTWITLVVAVVGVLLTFYAGMPAMVRTRFSTPTIGRDWMLGELGEVVAPVDPVGVVRIREALWRAETNRATPSVAGETVRVVGLRGLLLEVEPEEGGAVDYREGRGPGSDPGAPGDGGS